MKQIAVISMARDDRMFIYRWIGYYSKAFGAENLYLVLDGFDQHVDTSENINIIKIPHRTDSRRVANKKRAEFVSDLAKGLFKYYDLVIAHDIDEYLVLDPKLKMSLSDYLQKTITSPTVSGLGLDIAQHIDIEQPLDLQKSMLEQRQFALVSSEYTKPVLATKPVVWGSGFHRVKIKDFHIDENLFLFHFGMVDFAMSRQKRGDTSKIHETIALHLEARYNLFNKIKSAVPVDGDTVFDKARKYQYNFFNRRFLWPTKPAQMKKPVVVKIPDRFRGIWI